MNKNIRKKLVNNSFVLATCLLIIFSCGTIYHIEFPQPVDGKNLYHFPQSLRGTWVDTDKTKHDDSWVIEKNKVLYRMKTPKIYNGILDSVSKKRGEGLKHIEYDDQNVAIDTVIDYVVKNNRLYIWEIDDNKKRFLTPGFPVALKNDTLYALSENNFTLTCFSLGPDAFLRKISADQYILNIKEGNFIDSFFKSEGHEWWQIALLERTFDGHLKVSSLDFDKIPDHSDLVDCIYNPYHECYINIEWTRQDIIKMMNDKNFHIEPILDLKK